MTRARTFLLVCCGMLAPASALAHGAAVEASTLFVQKCECGMPAVEDTWVGVPSIGVAATATLLRWRDLTGDVQLAWAFAPMAAYLSGDTRTEFAEHAFVAGARVRWVRTWVAQPYVSVRTGPAFAWFDVSGDTPLESFDWAWRLDAALGVEGFLPFSAMLGRRPGWRESIENERGFSRPGLGLGVEIAYRLQCFYEFMGEPPRASDGVARAATSLGELGLSGLRLGVNLTARF